MLKHKQKRHGWFKASAPGRLDVMGGISDYSGGLVLQMPIQARTTAALRIRNDSLFLIRSDNASEIGLEPEVRYDLQQLPIQGGQYDWETLRQQFQGSSGREWALYALGCLLILNRDKDIELRGMDVRIRSQVPLGKSVSSSAAMEVAVMNALSRAFHVSLGARELPILCQRVENEVVGAPCGLMDQLASHLGRKQHLLPIVCQPDRVQEGLPIPSGMSFLGLDSGVRHAVGGASYTDVRTAAFMAYTIIAITEGASRKEIRTARRTKDWSSLPYGGYLANIPPSLFETRYHARLPDEMPGRDFLKAYGTTTDAVTEPLPNTIYRLRACARHPILERFRVELFQDMVRMLLNNKLRRVERKAMFGRLGELMYQSHASYSSCGLGNEWTDRLVEYVRERGPENGLFGAKITGGGSGGTVCVMAIGAVGRREARLLFAEYRQLHNQPLAFFTGSGEGALFSRQGSE